MPPTHTPPPVATPALAQPRFLYTQLAVGQPHAPVLMSLPTHLIARPALRPRSRDLLGRYFQNGFDGFPAQHFNHFVHGQPALLNQLHHRQQLLSAVAEELGELALAQLPLAAHYMVVSSHGGFSFYGFCHLDSKESKGLPPLQLATMRGTPSWRWCGSPTEKFTALNYTGTRPTAWADVR